MGTCDVRQVVVMYEVITADVCDFVVLIAEHILAPEIKIGDVNTATNMTNILMHQENIH